MCSFKLKGKMGSMILCLLIFLIFLSAYQYVIILDKLKPAHISNLSFINLADDRRDTKSGNNDNNEIMNSLPSVIEPKDEHDITESKERTKNQEVEMGDSLEDAQNIDTSAQHQRDQSDAHQVTPDSELDCFNLAKTLRHKDPYPLKLLDLKPPSFLPNYQNPCWYEQFPDEFLYSEYTMCKHGKAPRVYKKAAELWENLQAKGTRWRLRCLPYFYIIGVTKSGTTEMFQKINKHPMVHEGVSKEPQWWNRERIKMPVPKDPLKDFLDLYDEAAAQIESYTIPGENGTVFHPLVTGEASAGTIWLYDLWDRLPENKGLDEPKVITAHYIHHFQPDVKTILMLRNPTTRLYSDYYYFHKAERNMSSSLFHEKVIKSIAITTECLQQFSVRRCVYNNSLFLNSGMPIGAIRRSIYFPFVKDWLKVFPRDQVYIVKLEDYSKNRFKYLADIFQFLGLDGLAADAALGLEGSRIANQQQDKRPRLLPETKKILDEFFAPYNRKLASLLQDDRFLWET